MQKYANIYKRMQKYTKKLCKSVQEWAKFKNKGCKIFLNSLKKLCKFMQENAKANRSIK